MKNLEKYLIYFTVYSVIGWIYEVVLETFIYGWGFSNRGVLIGPYCPIYGVGALLFIFTVNKLICNKNMAKRLWLMPLVFMLCMIEATAVELIGSYILEYFTGSWPWQTYVDYKINFQGRIALSTSIRFGIGGIIILYIIQPLIEKLVYKIRKLDYVSICIVIIFAFDISYNVFIK